MNSPDVGGRDLDEIGKGSWPPLGALVVGGGGTGGRRASLTDASASPPAIGGSLQPLAAAEEQHTPTGRGISQAVLFAEHGALLQQSPTADKISRRHKRYEEQYSAHSRRSSLTRADGLSQRRLSAPPSASVSPAAHGRAFGAEPIGRSLLHDLSGDGPAAAGGPVKEGTCGGRPGRRGGTRAVPHIPPIIPVEHNSRLTSQYSVTESMGFGNFGSVVAAVSDLDNKMYAIKQTQKTVLGVTDVQHRLQEVYALSSCSSSGFGGGGGPSGVSPGSPHASDYGPTPHLIRYFDSWLEDDGSLCIQTELVRGGSLHKNVVANPSEVQRRAQEWDELLRHFGGSCGATASDPKPAAGTDSTSPCSLNLVQQQACNKNPLRLHHRVVKIPLSEEGGSYQLPPLPRGLNEFRVWELLFVLSSSLYGLHVYRSTVHLDIKPDNIMLDVVFDDGHGALPAAEGVLRLLPPIISYKVADFGLARPLNSRSATGETFIGVNDDEGDKRYLCPWLLSHAGGPARHSRTGTSTVFTMNGSSNSSRLPTVPSANGNATNDSSLTDGVSTGHLLCCADIYSLGATVLELCGLDLEVLPALRHAVGDNTTAGISSPRAAGEEGLRRAICRQLKRSVSQWGIRRRRHANKCCTDARPSDVKLAKELQDIIDRFVPPLPHRHPDLLSAQSAAGVEPLDYEDMPVHLYPYEPASDELISLLVQMMATDPVARPSLADVLLTARHHMRRLMSSSSVASGERHPKGRYGRKEMESTPEASAISPVEGGSDHVKRRPAAPVLYPETYNERQLQRFNSLLRAVGKTQRTISFPGMSLDAPSFDEAIVPDDREKGHKNHDYVITRGAPSTAVNDSNDEKGNAHGISSSPASASASPGPRIGDNTCLGHGRPVPSAPMCDGEPLSSEDNERVRSADESGPTDTLMLMDSERETSDVTSRSYNTASPPPIVQFCCLDPSAPPGAPPPDSITTPLSLHSLSVGNFRMSGADGITWYMFNARTANAQWTCAKRFSECRALHLQLRSTLVAAGIGHRGGMIPLPEFPSRLAKAITAADCAARAEGLNGYFSSLLTALQRKTTETLLTESINPQRSSFMAASRCSRMSSLRGHGSYPSDPPDEDRGFPSSHSSLEGYSNTFTTMDYYNARNKSGEALQPGGPKQAIRLAFQQLVQFLCHSSATGGPGSGSYALLTSSFAQSESEQPCLGLLPRPGELPDEDKVGNSGSKHISGLISSVAPSVSNHSREATANASTSGPMNLSRIDAPSSSGRPSCKARPSSWLSAASFIRGLFSGRRHRSEKSSKSNSRQRSSENYSYTSRASSLYLSSLSCGLVVSCSTREQCGRTMRSGVFNYPPASVFCTNDLFIVSISLPGVDLATVDIVMSKDNPQRVFIKGEWPTTNCLLGFGAAPTCGMPGVGLTPGECAKNHDKAETAADNAKCHALLNADCSGHLPSDAAGASHHRPIPKGVIFSSHPFGPFNIIIDIPCRYNRDNFRLVALNGCLRLTWSELKVV